MIKACQLANVTKFVSLTNRHALSHISEVNISLTLSNFSRSST